MAKLSGAQRRKLTKRRKRRNAVPIRGDDGPKCETRWASFSAGNSLTLENVILAQSLSAHCVLPLVGHHCVVFLIHQSPRCRLLHDIPAYLNAKPRDIFFPSESMLSNEPPFVALPNTAKGTEKESEEPFVSTFEATGSCRIVLKCRFLGGYMHEAEDGTISLVEDEEKKRVTLTANTELNFVSPSTLKLLGTKTVDLCFSSLDSNCSMKQRSIQHQSLIATFKSSRYQVAVRMARRTTTMFLPRRKAWACDWQRLLMQTVNRRSWNYQHLSQRHPAMSRPPRAYKMVLRRGRFTSRSGDDDGTIKVRGLMLSTTKQCNSERASGN